MIQMQTKESTSAEKKALRAKRQRRTQIIRRIKVGTGLCFVLAVVLYLLCAFVFFRIDSVVVLSADGADTQASKYYSDEDIIKVSGAEKGESLVLVSKKDIKNAVETLLPYIGNVTVKRGYPSTLKLVVEDYDAFFAVEKNGIFTLMNRDFKVLETADYIPDGCARLTGIDFSEMYVGYEAVFEEDAAKTRLNSLIAECETAGIRNITKYDLTNIANVRIVMNNRITFVLGTLTGLQDKLSLGLKTAETELQINPQAHIIIDVTNPERSYVRDDHTPVETNSQPDETTTTQEQPENEEPENDEVKPEPVG